MHQWLANKHPQVHTHTCMHNNFDEILIAILSTTDRLIKQLLILTRQSALIIKVDDPGR